MAAKINNIEMLGISKRFGSFVALEDVDITIKPGKIHAILGQADAGKSSLMKILGGIYKPDAGSMRINNQIYQPSNPNQARKKGIFLTLPLIDELTVAENIFLANEITTLTFRQFAKMNRLTVKILTDLGHGNIKPKEKAANLTLPQRRIVQIARPLAHDPKLIIIDEPQSNLPPKDIASFLKNLRIFKRKKIAVVLISRTADIPIQIADDFTVLRNGKVTGKGQADKKSIEEINFMITDYLPSQFTSSEKTPKGV